MDSCKNMGVIYILTNKAFSNLVKIGYADDLEKRVAQLNSSDALPYPFEIYAYYTVPSRLTDLKLHGLIDKLNPSLRTRSVVNGRTRVREFFELTPEDAFSILEAIAEISDTREHLKKYSEQDVLPIVKKPRIQAQSMENIAPKGVMKSDDIFKFCSNNLTAFMRINDNKYVVLQGAELGIERESLQKSLSRLRQQLRSENKINVVDGINILNVDITFNSPSAAAKFVAGSSVDGWKYWMNSDGIRLEDLR